MILGLFAFAALTFVALGAASNIYAAVFPQDTSTQDLAQRLEFLACENNHQATNTCIPSQRPAQMVFGLGASDTEDIMVVFERGGQDIVWDHTVIRTLPFYIGHVFPLGTSITTVTYSNPLDSAAVCRGRQAEILHQANCVPLLINETTKISRHLGPRGQRSYPTPKHEEYTALYNDSLAYGESVVSAGLGFGGDINLPRAAFLFYLEYTPPIDNQPPRLLVTRYDARTYEAQPPEAARVGVRYDGDPLLSNRQAVDAQGRQITYRHWCYDGEWKYALSRRNQWHPAGGTYYEVNSGGRQGHQQLTRTLTASDFETGLQTLRDYGNTDEFIVELPTDPTAVRGACT